MYFQVLACIIANLPGLSVGLAMGFSAILIPQVSFIDADDNTVSTDPENLKVLLKKTFFEFSLCHQIQVDRPVVSIS